MLMLLTFVLCSVEAKVGQGALARRHPAQLSAWHEEGAQLLSARRTDYSERREHRALICAADATRSRPRRILAAMTSFVGLLRAVNVGGTGKLPMAELKAMCQSLGFLDVRTYIASGNVMFTSKLGETRVKALLEAELLRYAGKPVDVMVRSHAELRAVLANNPFADAPGNRCLVIFLDAAPARDALGGVSGQTVERVALGSREIYVHYGDDMARSKLKIPAAARGTARNLNTVSKLAALSAP